MDDRGPPRSEWRPGFHVLTLSLLKVSLRGLNWSGVSCAIESRIWQLLSDLLQCMPHNARCSSFPGITLMSPQRTPAAVSLHSHRSWTVTEFPGEARAKSRKTAQRAHQRNDYKQ